MPIEITLGDLHNNLLDHIIQLVEMSRSSELSSFQKRMQVKYRMVSGRNTCLENISPGNNCSIRFGHMQIVYVLSYAFFVFFLIIFQQSAFSCWARNIRKLLAILNNCEPENVVNIFITTFSGTTLHFVLKEVEYSYMTVLSSEVCQCT